MSVPLQPKRRLVMPRKWGAEPEQRMTQHLMYRRSRYGQGQPAPVSNMMRNMRQSETFRRNNSYPA